MSTFRTYLLLLLSTVLMYGCQHEKTIPDSELKQIFKDFYLVNSYYSTFGLGRLSKDSIDIYRPVLQKYGYTVSDFTYTITNFSQRKSARLSDILNEAIKDLDWENDALRRRVADLDTIETRARAILSRRIYSDSLIRIRTKQDTARLAIAIPTEKGTYQIDYSYYIDSLDRNPNLRSLILLTDTAGRRRTVHTNWMSMRRRQRQSVQIEAMSSDTLMQIRFANYRKEMTTPNLRIDSLRITYYLPKETALDSVGKLLTYYKLRSYGPVTDSLPQDSGTLCIHPPLLDARRRDYGIR